MTAFQSAQDRARHFRVSFRVRMRAAVGETLPQSTMAFFFTSFAMMLASGAPVAYSLQRAAHGLDPELERICETIAPRLRAGASLPDVLRPYSSRFPDMVLPILEVGDASGSMEGAARRLAAAFSTGSAIERKFGFGVYDPRLAIAALTLVNVIFSFIPVWTYLLIFAAVNYIAWSFAFFCARIVSRWLMRWRWLRLQIDCIKLALPRVGGVLRNLAMARWARSFATLWNAGVPVSHALEISSRSALNAYYERRLLLAAAETRHGRTIRDTLASTQLLPPYLLGVIAAGETSGELGVALEHLAAEMENDAYAKSIQEMNLLVGIGQIVFILIVVAAHL